MQKVSITKQNNIAEIKPITGISGQELSKIVDRHLSYNRKERTSWQERMHTGKRFSTTTVALYKFQSETDSIFIPRGLIQRTIDTLKSKAIEHDFIDLTPVNLPDPQLQKMQLNLMGNRPDQMECLAKVFTSDGGVIEGPTGLGKTFMICQIVRAYPTARILICSYRKDVLKSIHERLKEHVNKHELGFVGGSKKDLRRVTAVTADSLLHAKPEECDLFLYDEVHEAASERRSKYISAIKNAKRFGFSASPQGRSDGADLVIEALFGPVIFKQSYQNANAQGVVATIDVKCINVSGQNIPFDEEVEQYRYGIWRNSLRNNLIALAAKRGLETNRQTLIIVDKLEHALALKNILVDWPLVHGPTSEEQIRYFTSINILPNKSWLCSPDQRDYMRTQFEHGKMRFAIATGVWSQGVDMRHLDLLIRGDARSAAIPSTQIPGRLSRGKHGTLVDFNDRFDERFLRRSKARLALYASKGWNIQADCDISDI